jgi:Imelysin
LSRRLLLLAPAAVTVSLAFATPASAASPPGLELKPVKRYLLSHTARLTGFTGSFKAEAARYDALARSAGYDYAELWRTRRAEVKRTLARAKAAWIRGNPYYERVEGVVAGTPTLARYDVILDAGASAQEDPANAVPFDVKLSDGRVLRKPGNFFNLTEGMLWGTRPAFRKSKTDLDGDGRLEFGEVLPDAIAFQGTAAAFDLHARRLARAAARWKPTASDAFTAVVVMVPTMNEYFGQWKTSRFVLGSKARGDAFNVVSRLSDIHDILSGIRVIYRGIAPAIAKRDRAQSTQTARELASLSSFVARLQRQERGGRRFKPEQADILGRQAQERATAIAGQVTQAAARLKVKIVQ